MTGDSGGQWRVATLGPAGTDHEQAARAYARRRLGPAVVELLDGFDAAGPFLAVPGRRLVVANTAHPDIDLLFTRDWRDVRMLDFFARPTMPLALVRRADCPEPRSIALMPSTRGYVDVSRWQRVVPVSAKPLAAERVLAGEADAAIVSMPTYEQHRPELELVEAIGPVLCGWLVFGRAGSAAALPRLATL